jgi:hypothetical protein
VSGGLQEIGGTEKVGVEVEEVHLLLEGQLAERIGLPDLKIRQQIGICPAPQRGGVMLRARRWPVHGTFAVSELHAQDMIV